MTETGITAILRGLSIEELEMVIRIARHNARWEADDLVHAFDRGAYSYWLSGFPDGPWSLPETHPDRRAWDKKREQLWELRRKFEEPQYVRVRPTESRCSLMWRSLFVGVVIGAAITCVVAWIL